MNFSEYQSYTDNTAIYPDAGKHTDKAINYVILGLIGESGELANKWKKYCRDNISSLEMKQFLLDELGDVLYYVARLAEELNSDLDLVAERNIDKLADRKSRDVIKGSGDHR